MNDPTEQYLSDNQLEIMVGSDWVPPFRLQEAHLASCQMGPLFPAWLKWQVDLTYIDLSQAQEKQINNLTLTINYRTHSEVK